MTIASVSLPPPSAAKRANKSKVLVIGPTPPPQNGMSVATALLLRALEGETTTIHLDTGDHRGLSNVGRVDFRNLWLAFKHAVRYVHLLISQNPDIIYVPIAQDTLAFVRDGIFLIPARVLGKKIVVHLHGGHFRSFYDSASLPMRFFVRYCIEKSYRAVVLGKCLNHMFGDLLPAERIQVIPNGIPDNFSAPDLSKKQGEQSTILFLSTLMREKGVLDLLAALPEIAKEVPNVRLILAGEWLRSEEEAEAKQIIQEFNLQSRVRMVGPVDGAAKHDAFREADIFVMPTYYKNEGHPYVLLEAMSAGLPIICTNAGCIAETVIDGLNGFIVPARSQTDLKRGVASVLLDDKLRQQMGKASRERFLAHYSFEHFSTNVRRLIDSVGGEA